MALAAKDRAAQILGDAGLSFSKMAELIEQRRLLLRCRIVANIKRMDQPGMLGDAAFRDAGSALRREGQSFRQIAEAIELTGRPAPGYEDPVQQSEPLQRTASEPGNSAWRRALALVRKIVFFPLRRRMLSLAIALIAILLLYALQGFLAIGEHVLGNSDGIAAIRHSAAMSSVDSFVNKNILPQSKEATVPPTSPAPISSPPAAAPSPPFATPSAAPAAASAPRTTAPTPAANASADLAPSPAAPVAPSTARAGPPVSTPPRDAKGAPPSRSVANYGAAREDRYPSSRRDAHPENDRPRAFEDMTSERMRRISRMAGPCIGGVGGRYWGGGRY